MHHSQKTEVLNNEDVAIERLCANTVALVKHAGKYCCSTSEYDSIAYLFILLGSGL